MKPSHNISPTSRNSQPSRPSLANTSYSGSTSTYNSPGADDSPMASNWEQSDIRRDVAAGWSGMAHDASAAIGGLGGSNNSDIDDEWDWRLQLQAVRNLPPFYPLDPRSTRRLYLVNDLDTIPGLPLEDRVQGISTMDEKASVKEELGVESKVADTTSSKKAVGEQIRHSITDISHRISNACQHLSIQASWDNRCPSATLFTMERVEMVISMYFEDIPTMGREKEVLLIEVQRRKGCPIAFHNYRRNLLDAAEGKFDPDAFHRNDGLEKPNGRDRCNQPRASLSRHKPTLSRPALRPPSFSADDAAAFACLKTESSDSSSHAETHPLRQGDNDSNDTIDKALVALNIAASLIKKDRLDARRLGMESLILLTDPLRAGIETARIASRVVLMGTAREDMMWKANDVSVGFGADDDIDELFDESAGLGIRETILEMIMGDDFEGKSSEDEIHGHDGIDKEFKDSLFQSCLSVLSNALNTLESSAASPNNANHVEEDDQDDRKPSPTNRRRATTEPSVRPSLDRNVSKRFLDDTTSTFGCDVLSSLIRILGQAKSNPHDAYHSARCLGVLFKGCGNLHKARARRDLDAKRIVSAALEVGARSHAKLAGASRVAMVALVMDDENSIEEEGKTELEYQQGDEEGHGIDEVMETAEGEQHHSPSSDFRKKDVRDRPY